MKNLMLFLFLLLSIGCVKHDPFEPSLTSKSIQSEAEEPANEIIVQFKRGVDKSRINGRFKDRLNTKAMQRVGYEAIDLIEVDNVNATISELKKSGLVEFAEPNYKVEPIANSNDPYYLDGSLWGMKTIGADKAWASGNTGKRDVFIGIIDEGIMYFHPDLCGQVWENPYDPIDGADNDGNGYIDDTHGWDFYNGDRTIYDGRDNHGTHVSGTIAGAGFNGQGVIGVSPQATLISAKFLQGSGSIYYAIKALDYLTDLKIRHGINIVATTNSWGGGGFSQGMVDAIERSKAANMLFVAAAGNDAVDNDITPHYPSSYDNDNIIAVASTTSVNGLSGFSCWGSKSVDLGAPGSGIWSTIGGTPADQPSYASFNGTSMATPHVTGAVALYAALNPSATYSQIKNAILNATVPIAALAGKCVTGGLLNVSTFLGETPVQAPKPTDCTVPPLDLIPPTPPQNVRLASNTDSSMLIQWDPPTDNVGIQQIQLYYKVPGSSTTYGWFLPATATYKNLTGLIKGATYDVWAYAFDKTGNASPKSNQIQVVLSQPPPPLPDPVLTMTGEATPGIHTLSWKLENRSAKYYFVQAYTKGQFASIGSTAQTSFTVAPTGGGTETYRIVAVLIDDTFVFSNTISLKVINKNRK